MKYLYFSGFLWINNEVAGIKMYPCVHTHMQRLAHLPAENKAFIAFHFNKPLFYLYKLKISHPSSSAAPKSPRNKNKSETVHHMCRQR